MSTKKESDQTKVSSKKTMINETALKLSTALESLKEELGKKKFEKRIRKATKLITGGLKLGPQKKPALKKQAPSKKVTKKAAKAIPAKKNTSAKQKK